MARTRPSASAGGFSPGVLVVLTICLVFGLYLLCYIQLKNDVERLHKDIGRLNTAVADQRILNQKLEAAYNRLSSREHLAEQVRQLGLGLALPEVDRTRRLPEPLTDPPLDVVPSRVARRPSRRVARRRTPPP